MRQPGRQTTIVIHSLVLLVAGVACGREGPAPVAGVRDSAGVSIVEISFAGAERWSLSSEPVLELSRRDDPSREFFRVTDGAFLADGAMAVLNASTYQVRVFTPDGTLALEFGREGDGPGEFRMPYGLFEVPGVGLVVHDIGRATLAGFDRAGRLVMTASLPPLSVWSLASGWLEADQVLLGAWTEMPVPGEVRRQFMQYLAYSWTTGTADTLARIPSGTISYIGGFEPWGVVGGGLFEAQAHGVVASGLAVVGDGAISELRGFDVHGVVRCVVRWREDRRPVRDEDLDAYRAAKLDGTADPVERSMMRKQLAATPVADHFPAVGDLRADRDGRLWIARAPRPRDTVRRWYVVSLDGRLVAGLDMPLGMRLLDAAAHRVLVVEPDAMDVERVWVYGLGGR